MEKRRTGDRYNNREKLEMSMNIARTLKKSDEHRRNDLDDGNEERYERGKKIQKTNEKITIFRAKEQK